MTSAAILEVDLTAVAANWVSLVARHPTGPVAGVLKADGYGLGAGAIATRLHKAGCRHFFTAHLDEALEVRALVPASLVAVLNGLLPGTEADYVLHDITPVLGSLDEIGRWSAQATAASRVLPALLHVDTGMARLGLDLSALTRLAAEPALLAGIDVRYVMTHLVAAEMPDEPINATQLRRFQSACAALPPAPRSLANSSGIFLGPTFGSDLARPGAALYGINPTPGQPNPMQPVVRLRARILQTRMIAAGDTVGYNATFTASRPTRIATIGVGYADGWQRSRSGRGAAAFDGRPVPLVGRVSMDLTTYDITDHPDITVGSWLDLIGPGCSPDEAAAAAGTNGYEVLTALGRRYFRVAIGA